MLNFNLLYNFPKSNPHYIKRYLKHVLFCSERNVNNSYDFIYYENHHILPCCHFPEFSSFSNYPFNKAKLTYKEHVIAHHLLAKAISTKEAWFGFKMMLVKTQYRKEDEYIYNMPTDYEGYITEARSEIMKARWSDENYRIKMLKIFNTDEYKSKMSKSLTGKQHSEESKQYMKDSWDDERKSNFSDYIKFLWTTDEYREKCTLALKNSWDENRRIEFSNIMQGTNNPFFGCTHTQETKERISTKRKELLSDKTNHPFYGKQHSEESKQKMSKSALGRKCGPHSEEHKNKLSESAKKRPRKICPKCNKSFAVNVFKRHVNSCQ